MSCSRPRAALLVALAAAACSSGVPPSFAPRPLRIDPAGGPRNVDAQVTILGEHFYARGVQSLSSNGGIFVDDGYSAILGGVPLRDVVRVSDTELRAVLPAGLAAGAQDLVVVSSDGMSGTLARGWLASDLTPARLLVTAAAPPQVSTGQSFAVAIDVRNTGGAAARSVSPSQLAVSGAGAATALLQNPPAQDIPGGESRTFLWSMMAKQAGTLTLGGGAAGVDEVSQRPVNASSAAAQMLIQLRSALEAAAEAPAPMVVSVGQSIAFTLLVTNTGTATAQAVSFPSPLTGAELALISAPAPQDVPGAMGSRAFTWIYRAGQAGRVAPAVVGGSGTDENDRLPVPVPARSWPAATIQLPAQLSASPGPVPAQVSIGQSFPVTLLTSNTGEAAAKSVIASLQQAGPGAVAVVSAPATTDLPGGASTTFSWTLQATAGGAVSLALSASGADANSGAAVQTLPPAAGPVLVQTPPQLTATATVSPTQASTGQPIELRLDVANAGQATAAAVLPTPPIASGPGTRLLQSPAAQDVPGGTTRSFLWSYAVDSAGAVNFSVSAAGKDQNSGVTVQAPTATSNAVTVSTAAFLQAVAATDRTQVSVGQDVVLKVDVHNVGQADALGVTCTATLSGSGSATLVSSPAAQDVPAQAIRSFQWTFHTTGAGSLSFSVGASGTDKLSGATVSTTASASPTAVQTPPALSGAAQLIPAQASTGQLVTLRLDVTNAGQATAAGVTATATGGSGVATQTAAPAAQDVPGGQTRSFSWTYQGTASGTLQLSASAAGADANSGLAVSAAPASASAAIQTRAALSAVARLSRGTASVGQTVQLLLDVTNSGQAAALQFTPAAPAASGPGAQIASSPPAADVPGGATLTFTWTISAQAAASVSFSVAGSATDANSSAAVPLAAATSPALLIQTPAQLSAAARLSAAQVDVGQSFQLLLDVTNAGQAGAAVAPGTPALVGTGAAQVTSAPAGQTVPGLSTRTFAWTFSPMQKGTLRFTVGASASDVNSGASVDPAPATSPSLLAQVPAALSASIGVSPATVNTGQPATVSLTVANSGEAAVQAVSPALTVGGAGATLVSGPTPANATIAGASGQTFTWSYRGAATGTATFSATASGTGANTGQPVSAPASAPANLAVQTPAALSATFAVPSQPVNVGQAFSVSLVASNTGDSAASAVSPSTPVLAGTGGATLSAGATPASATVPGHGSQTFIFGYTGSAAGSLTFAGSASGTDATDGNLVSSATANSAAVTVQTPSALSATLTVPRDVPLGDTFTPALTVTNSGDASVTALTPGSPAVVASSTGTAALVSGPSPGTPITLAGHSSQAFTWVFTATGAGTLQLSAQASGSDANDGSARSVAATSAAALVGETALVAADPFGDGTAFSFLLSFSGQVWLGPAANGTGAVRMNADGSGAQLVPWQLEHNAGAKNTAYTGVPAHTIGFKGCAANSAQCGPDNESGRGLFFNGVIAGTEWLGLAGAHANAGTDFARFVYLTQAGFPLATGGYTDFAYADLSNKVSSSTVSITAAAAYHDRLYLGFQDGSGSSSPMLEALTAMPPLPGSSPTGTLLDMGAVNMPGVGGGLRLDSMAVLGAPSNDALYLANASGFTRSTSATPGQCQVLLLLLLCPDWTNATPSAAAYGNKTSLASSKTSDLEPADRAVPAMVSFGGRLFAARNTTTGPQLWSCDPARGGTAAQCDPGDWSLVAPNTSGDTRLTQFNDASNAAVTLLAATPQHLFVGFNNATRGIVVYRTGTAAAASATDFSGRQGCAATGNGCPGLGGDGLGKGLTRIFDGKALSFAGADFLYLAAGTGTSPVRVYRAAP
ncbi:MAG TPA: hypothetical protein VEQ15_13540 [Myxococcales bacterium]|nr:hypothetical protein [Myxococcales bacterium]